MEQLQNLFHRRDDLLKALEAEKKSVIAVPVGADTSQGYELGSRFGQRDAYADTIALIRHMPPLRNERIDKERMVYYNGYISRSDLIKGMGNLLELHTAKALSEPNDDGYAKGKYIAYGDQLQQLLQEISEFPGVTREELIAKKPMQPGFCA